MPDCEQAPAPSQCPTGVSEPAAQVTLPHDTAMAAFAQTPPGPHEPVFPQGGAAVHIESAPLVTAVHVPAEPVALQVWQAPPHAVPQHTPSTHVRLVAQSLC